MRIGKVALLTGICIGLPSGNVAFSPTTLTKSLNQLQYQPQQQQAVWKLQAASEDDNNEEGEDDGKKKEENPYSDPNYPDLEFVNYDDPEYKVDQGVGDEFFDPKSTEEQIEEMREERRQRNDEYQFETYYKDILQRGQEYKGEWTVFETSTFVDDVENDPTTGIPRLMKVANPLKVISWAERITMQQDEDPSSSSKDDDGDVLKFACDNDRIIHREKIYSNPDEDGGKTKGEKQLKLEQSSIAATYWPKEMAPFDFRGQQGNMCVGSGYTICTASPLLESSSSSSTTTTSSEGPFSVYRTELGVLSDVLRLRVKLDYSVLEDEKAAMESPPLHLRTMTICRETLDAWPRADKYKSAIEAKTEIPFFGPAGAPGGLYDPPPVGSEEQAAQYLMLDLEGCATLLLPYKMDQDESTHLDSSGWVTSLDWTPGPIRFQLDRKVHNGKGILGLRTLELSEVQGSNADQWRPKDGGANMRQ